ncbi:MAG: two-component regulator propeller domain-containing protein [Taibaiella sp.]|jgi:signal transduction histidine kinase
MKQHLFGLFLLLLIVKGASAQKATGFSITHYTNENGLPQNSVKGIEMDKNGFLWVATESGLLRFDGQQFKLYDKNHFPVIASNRLRFLGLTKDSLIFFYDDGRNYYSFNKQQKIILSKFYIDEKVKRDTYDPLLDKTNGKDEGFVEGGDKGVFYFSGKKKLWTRDLPDADNNSYRTNGSLNGKFYYLTKQFTIKSVDRNGVVKEVLLKGIHQSLKVAGLYPNNYCFLQQAEALYLLLGKCIYRLHQSGEQELTAHLMLESDVPGIFTYRNYPALNLQVIGSITHGLYLYRKKQFKALRHTNGFGIFYPQAVYRDSGVLTSRGLVYPSSSKFNYPFGITDIWRSLLRDSRGHYWINMGWIRNGKSYNVTELNEQLKFVRRYRSPSAHCCREAPDGNIWVSIFKGYCIGKVSGDSVKWMPNLRSGGHIITFLPESKDEFWIGGINAFARLNVRTGKEQHYKSLEQFTIETLYLDVDKVLWIGTTGNGFFALKQNKIYQFPLDIKNNLSNVHAFIEDKSGFMWMSTNNGLFRCKKEDLKNFIDHKATTVYYQYFNKDAGFNTNEFNGSCTPSAIVLGNGKFSFPSLDGLVQFYPDSIQEILPVNKIFIDKLLVDGKKHDLSKHPTLDPSFKRLEIEVASPFFGNPVNQQIEYNIKGLDQNWYPVKNDNIVTLNNLPYGKYSLQFRKRAGFGSNMITTVLSFTVKPFFYQTWYFRLAVLVLVMIIIFVLVRIRYANLMKRNRVLEQEVSQRTLHLQNANRLKEKMLMMVGHDLQSPLHFLRLLSDNITDALKQQQLEQVHNGTAEIKSTAGRIHAFVKEFSMWTRLQDENLGISKCPFSLPELLEELAQFFEGMLLQHDNRLQLDIEAPYELYTNRDLLKAILRNIIDNANKHTRKGLIRIHCYEERVGMLNISISDTGNGMSSIELHNIRRRIAQEEGAFNTGHTSKLGYQLIIDFVERLSAGIAIDSEKDKGTTVIIYGVEIHSSDNSDSALLPGKTIGSSELY